MYRTLACLFLPCALACGTDAQRQGTWPPWDGQESIEQYAKRVNLPPAKKLDLGGGMALEVVLIPAGSFTMGTARPPPTDDERITKAISVGQVFCVAGAGVLLLLIAWVLVRAIRRRRRPQYSLAYFLVMNAAACTAMLGGMHWWFSLRALKEYRAGVGRYRGASKDEKPAHEVTITRPFYLGKYEVTQEQYQRVMPRHISYFQGPSLPVDTLGWENACEFCTRLSQSTGEVMRLPSEAEWERACRAGTNTVYNTGDSAADLERAGWVRSNSGNSTHPVGGKVPNAWGLYDTHGNVSEWCLDEYIKYNQSPAVDPKAPPAAGFYAFAVLRGGTWNSDPGHCHSASRYADEITSQPTFFGLYGFRVLVEARAGE